MNSITIIGNMARDIETRYTQDGRAIAGFAVADNRGEKVSFIDCSAFGKTAEFLAKHFRKGQKIALNGRLEINEWTGKDGVKRREAQVIVSEVAFADSKPKEEKKPDEFVSVPEGITEELPFM